MILFVHINYWHFYLFYYSLVSSLVCVWSNTYENTIFKSLCIQNNTNLSDSKYNKETVQQAIHASKQDKNNYFNPKTKQITYFRI